MALLKQHYDDKCAHMVVTHNSSNPIVKDSLIIVIAGIVYTCAYFLAFKKLLWYNSLTTCLWIEFQVGSSTPVTSAT